MATKEASTAHLQLFKNSTSYSHLQRANGYCRHRQLRLAENINGSVLTQAISFVGKPSALWETRGS
jgi:hypothetical protein